MKKHIILYGLFFLLLSCGQQQKPSIAFYYWKTVFKLSESEKNTIAENQVKKVYLRYFDVGQMPESGQPYPISPVVFNQQPVGLEIVPVIYIQNKVMLSPKTDLSNLAAKCLKLVAQINTKHHISYREIQIDCDWTIKSRDNYLKFVERVKNESGKELSATIRLHQVKYFRKTKIPNVDRGVLMYYNMGKIAPDSLNSIYDRKIAALYLKSLGDYPLPLDVALPIYSWGIHIRDGHVIGLKNKVDGADFKGNSNFTFDGNQFKTVISNYKEGTFYKAGDFLKMERIKTADLLQMAADLGGRFHENPKEIIFYDLDEFNTSAYEKSIFRQVIDCF